MFNIYKAGWSHPHNEDNMEHESQQCGNKRRSSILYYIYIYRYIYIYIYLYIYMLRILDNLRIEIHRLIHIMYIIHVLNVMHISQGVMVLPM